MNDAIYLIVRGSHFRIPIGSGFCFRSAYVGHENARIPRNLGFRAFLDPRISRKDRGS